MTEELVTLFRPVGPEEVALIRSTGCKAFPPRLPGQPIFYPVLDREYAIQISRRWNVADFGAGYVTRFQVRASLLEKYPVHIVGSPIAREYWIPAEELDEFNRNIVGLIEVTDSFMDTEGAGCPALR